MSRPAWIWEVSLNLPPSQLSLKSPDGLPKISHALCLPMNSVLLQSCPPGFPSQPMASSGFRAILQLLGHQKPLSQPLGLPPSTPQCGHPSSPSALGTILAPLSSIPVWGLSNGPTFSLALYPSEASPCPRGRIQSPFFKPRLLLPLLSCSRSTLAQGSATVSFCPLYL